MIFISLFFVSDGTRYVFGFSVIALNFVCWLVALYGAPARLHQFRGLYRKIAKGAFSAYLTHMFAIHVAAIAARRFTGIAEAELSYFVIGSVLCVLFALVFYFAVERPSLALRRVLFARH